MGFSKPLRDASICLNYPIYRILKQPRAATLKMCFVVLIEELAYKLALFTRQMVVRMFVSSFYFSNFAICNWKGFLFYVKTLWEFYVYLADKSPPLSTK
jgi:hypothetical protein